MGATKKRRHTKHRGNAAGMVEARGRSTNGRTGTASASGNRGPKPPQPASWNRAMTKALIPVGILVPLLLVLNKGKADVVQVLGMAALAYVLYVPLSYVTDRWMYTRYVKKSGLA